MSKNPVHTSIVVAVADNGVIGSDGAMPWRLSADLRRFKALTMGRPMIMGRKTFESIGKQLPGRTSIVVTRDEAWQQEGAVNAGSPEAALALARQVAVASDVNEICIVGGGEIYRQLLDQADRLYITRVHALPEGDAHFPDIDLKKWKRISCEAVPAGEKDSQTTTYEVYERL